MDVIIYISIFVRALTVLWAIVEWRRRSDRRHLVFVVVVFLLFLQQVVGLWLFGQGAEPAQSIAGILSLILQLAISLVLFFAAQNLDRLLGIPDVKSESPRSPYLNMWTFAIGLSAVLGIVLVAIFAFFRSQNEIQRIVAEGNLSVGVSLVDQALSEVRADPNVTLPEKLERIRTIWDRTESQFKSSFLCVIGPDGRLLLHSRKPEKIGSDARKVFLDSNVGNVENLLDQQTDWCGVNQNLSGRMQLVGYRFVPELPGLVAIHTLKEDVDSAYANAMFPWFVGVSLVGGVFLPLTLSLMFRNTKVATAAATESERQKSEFQNRFNRLFEMSTLGVIEIGLDGKVQNMNPNARSWFEESEEILTGRPFAETVAESNQGEVAFAIDQARQNKRQTLVFESTQGRINDAQFIPVGSRNGVSLILCMVEDVTEKSRIAKWLNAESAVLRSISDGDPQQRSFELLVNAMKEQSTDLMATILGLDGNQLFHLASAGVTDDWIEYVDGVVIGETVGSCGASAYSGKPVLVDDISKDPRWKEYVDNAIQMIGAAACWSVPILSSDSKVLGTVAIYRKTIGPFSSHESSVLENAARIASIIITRHEAIAAGEYERHRCHAALEAMTEAVWLVEFNTDHVWFNQAFRRLVGADSQSNSIEQLPMAVQSDHRVRFTLFLNKVSTLDEPAKEQFPFQTKSGEIRWMEVTLNPLDRSHEFEYSSPSNRLGGGYVGVAVDVTAHKTTEFRLKSTDAELWDIAEKLPIAITLRREKNHRFVNRQFVKMTGYSPEEGRKMALDDLMMPEWVGPVSEMIQKCEAGQVQRSDVAIRTKSGEVRWIDLMMTPVLLQGKTAVLSAGLDITELREAKLALHHSDSRFQSLVDLSSLGIQYNALDGEITFANQALADIYGTTVGNLIGASVTDFALDENDAQRVREYIAKQANGDAISPDCFETRNRRADGTIVDVRIEWRYDRDIHGKPRGFVVVVSDISERIIRESRLIHSEQRFRSIFEQAAIGVAIMDPDGTLVQVNDRFCGIMNQGRFNLLNLRWDEWTQTTCPEEDRATLEELQTGIRNEFKAQRKIDASGYSPLWINLHVTAISLGGSSQPQLIAMVDDISKMKNAETAVRVNELRYRSLVDATAATVWTTSNQGEFVVPQVKWTVFTGQPWPDHRGFNWADMIHRDDVQRMMDEWKSAVAGCNVLQSFGRIWHADSDSYRYCEVNAVPIYDEAGEVSEWFGVTIDNHQRYLIESELVSNNQRFTQMLTAMLDGYLLLDTKGLNILDTNRAYCEMMGRTREDVIGQSVFEFDCRTNEIEAKKIRNKIFESGGMRFYTAHRHQDGSEVELEVSVSLLSESVSANTMFVCFIRDVTRVRNSERQLRLTKFSVDTSRNAIFWIDRNSRFIYVNDSVTRLLGYSHEQIMNMGVPDIDPDYPQERWGAFWEKIRDVKSMSFDTRIRNVHGELIDVEVTTNFLEFEGDELVFAFVTDLTERKAAEADARLRIQAFDASPHGIIIVDAKNDELPVLYCNQKYESLTGTTRRDIVGQSVKWVDGDLYPALESIRHAIENDIKHPLNIKYQRSRGKVVWNELSITQVQNRDGQISHYIGFQMDVTERMVSEHAVRESEERFRTFCSLAPVGILLFDNDGLCEYVNQAAAKMLGCSPKSAGRKGWLRKLAPEDRDAFLPEWENAVEDGLETKTEIRFQTRSRVVTSVELFVTPRQDVEGEIVGFIGTMVDQTHRRTAEDELRRLQDEIARVGRLNTMSEMAAGLSHELSQPLNAIANYSSACLVRISQNGATDPVIHSSIESISELVVQSGRIIHGLREFVQQKPGDRRAVGIGELIRKTMEMMSFELRKSGVRTEFLLPEPDLVALIDPVQIRQVIINLLTNSIEAMSTVDRAKLISVSMQQKKDFLVVRIQDTGAGIPNHRLPHIFESFVTTKIGGTGIGLSISSRIVQKHNGFLKAWNNPDGNGAIFEFSLPLDLEQMINLNSPDEH